MLAEAGVGVGDRVAVLMAKSHDLVPTLLAIWRLGAVHVPLFTAFAAPAVGARVVSAGARVAVCDPDQRVKLDQVPGLLVLERGLDLDRLVAAASPWAQDHVTGPDDPFVQIYTSGTTGRPKAVAVPRRALAAFVSYLEFGLDVRDGDVYWNAADPGWATVSTSPSSPLWPPVVGFSWRPRRSPRSPPRQSSSTAVSRTSQVHRRCTER